VVEFKQSEKPDMKLTKIIAAIGVLGLPIAAFSQTLQTQSFNFTPNGEVFLVFNKVNIAPADVTEIKITIELSKVGGSLAVDNDSAASGTVTFTHTLSGALTSADVNLLDTSFSTAWASLNAVSSTQQNMGVTSGDPTNQFNVTAFSDYYQFTPSDVNLTSSASINSIFYGGYLGASGTYTLNFDANQLVSATGLGGLQQAFTVSQAIGSVTVEVVPEPTTALLVGAAGTALAFSRRRRA
jgi:hypothetical protein